MFMNFVKNRSIVTQIGFLFLLLAVLWFFGISAAMHNLTEKQLTAQAQTVVNNVQSLGQMVAGHGGIWVKGGEAYPYQYLEKRDIGNGEFIYSKNPALVQREFSESVLKNNFPASFRMTSLNVMNPSNQPNSFELFAMTEMKSALDNKEKVMPKISHRDGVFEYVEPVFHTKACIACHGNSEDAPASVTKHYGTRNGFGFKEGDLAGGISVKINYDESKIVKDIIDWKIVSFIIVPAIVFFMFIYFYARNISSLATRIANYRRGQNIGIDVKSIPDDTSNEIGQLVRSTSSLIGQVNGTNLQMEAIKKENQELKARAPKPTTK